MLFDNLARMASLEHVGAFTLSVQQEESGRAHHAFFTGQLLACALAHLGIDEVYPASVRLLDPIHDGVHLLAMRSGLVPEVDDSGTIFRLAWLDDQEEGESCQGHYTDQYQQCQARASVSHGALSYGGLG